MHSALSIEKINSVFDIIEQEVPVGSWEMNGLKIWPLLRNNHWSYLVSQKVFNPGNQIAVYGNPAKRLKQIAEVSRKLLQARQKDKAKNDRLRKTDILITVGSSTRFFKINEMWYSPYSDSLIKHFKEAHIDTLVLEFSSDGKCLSPRFAPSVYVQHKSFYLSILAKLKGRINVPVLKEDLEGWEHFQEIIHKELGADCVPNINTIRGKARQILLHEQWFSKILKTIQPKVAIVGYSYNSAEAMALIRACRKSGILTVEIQHGVQGQEHIGYRSWAKLPEQGYDTLPDIFWTWGEEEKKNIDSWANSRPHAHKAIVGGNPCLHIYDQKGSHYSHDAAKLLKLSGQDTLNVLFTAQAFDTLPSFLIEAIVKTPDWQWWIRIHPQYWKTEESIGKQLSENKALNARISTADQLPLIRLLEQSSVHVTEFSSSVLEAKTCGVASVVIHPSGMNIFKEFIESGYVVYADSAELLISNIQHQAKKKVHEIKTEDGSCFFPDIMNEIKKRIQ